MSADETRRRWAQAHLDRTNGALPVYGSPEWVALPDGPEKVAAVVHAAERCLYLEALEDLQLEHEASWLTHLHRLAEEGDWQARQDYHRRLWTGTGFRADPAIDADLEAEWAEWVRGGAA